MNKWAKGHFQIVNPHKYVGNRVPIYRSGWEHSFMMFLDRNEHILQWASESVVIPYRHPLTGKMANYVPDFLITYRTRDNTMRAELIEIKPKSQSIIEEKTKSRDRAIVAINHCKWAAAELWCKRNGLTFRVLNENHLFHQGNKNK